jgi:hypothetical protein
MKLKLMLRERADLLLSTNRLMLNSSLFASSFLSIRLPLSYEDRSNELLLPYYTLLRLRLSNR